MYSRCSPRSTRSSCGVVPRGVPSVPTTEAPPGLELMTIRARVGGGTAWGDVEPAAAGVPAAPAAAVPAAPAAVVPAAPAAVPVAIAAAAAPAAAPPAPAG